VHGVAAHEVTYGGVAAHLTEVWVALRASLRSVLDETSLQDVLTGELPPSIRKLTEASEAWLPR
jgi:DNA-binding IscR family transcriptional regulator